MMSIILGDIAILKIRNANYCCIITGISKNEGITLLQNIDFTEKVEHLNHQEQFEAINFLEILFFF